MDRMWLISTEIAGITSESVTGENIIQFVIRPIPYNVRKTTGDTENAKWIESYLVKYSVLSFNNENEQVKKVTKCMN